jgi:hypothetical protein
VGGAWAGAAGEGKCSAESEIAEGMGNAPAAAAKRDHGEETSIFVYDLALFGVTQGGV